MEVISHYVLDKCYPIMYNGFQPNGGAAHAAKPESESS